MAEFKEFLETTKANPVKKKPPIVGTPTTIICWRGFSDRALERDLVQGGTTSMLLSPYQANERVLWFTNSLQQDLGISPIDYALNHAGAEGAGWLLTYPLQAIKHMTPPENMTPDRFLEYHGAIYEVPKGWIFGHDKAKHLGCMIDLKINKKMMKKVQL